MASCRVSCSREAPSATRIDSSARRPLPAPARARRDSRARRPAPRPPRRAAGASAAERRRRGPRASAPRSRRSCARTPPETAPGANGRSRSAPPGPDGIRLDSSRPTSLRKFTEFRRWRSGSRSGASGVTTSMSRIGSGNCAGSTPTTTNARRRSARSCRWHRRAPVPPLPQAMAHDTTCGASGRSSLLVEQPPRGRLDAQHLEGVGRHPRTLEPLGLAVARQARAPVRVSRQARERARPAPVVHELRQRERRARVVRPSPRRSRPAGRATRKAARGRGRC